MRYLQLSAVLACMAICAGCSEKSPFIPESNLVVIQGYLYGNEPIKDIRVTSTLRLGSVDTIAPPVKDAQVQLIKNGLCYLLDPLFWKPGYYRYSEGTTQECPVCNLKVEPGDTFKIEVVYFGKVAYAQTIVPLPPQGIALSQDTIFVAAGSAPSYNDIKEEGLFADDSVVALTVSWQDDGNSMYYVALENKESFAQPIGPDYPFAKPGRYNSAPLTGDHFSIGMKNITHFGRYQIKVYRLNQEYAELYLTRNQDSRDLNEPLSNVNNGLGVFTAFNGTSIDFRIEKK
jgi:hypothetical protein